MGSVDGSHTEAATLADLKTASGALVHGGIVVLDDYFAETFPGVADGTHRFFYQHQGQPTSLNKEGGKAERAGDTSAVDEEQQGLLVPFLVGFNKVYFTHAGFAERYQDAVMALLVAIGSGGGSDALMVRTTRMLGHDVVVLAEKVYCYRAQSLPVSSPPVLTYDAARTLS